MSLYKVSLSFTFYVNLICVAVLKVALSVVIVELSAKVVVVVVDVTELIFAMFVVVEVVILVAIERFIVKY